MGTRSLVIVLATEVRPPPPMPAIARAKIIAFMVGATAHMMLPTVKKLRAMRSEAWRPKMSHRRPYRGVKQETDRRL
jgi:hypothetical protein